MLVTGLFHCAIKTNDLAATVAFYTKVLGLREVDGRRYVAGNSFFTRGC
jgi:catechol 2,3-dioxygenase-like lactoylglutathione lyase family enzyme